MSYFFISNSLSCFPFHSISPTNQIPTPIIQNQIISSPFHFLNNSDQFNCFANSMHDRSAQSINILQNNTSSDVQDNSKILDPNITQSRISLSSPVILSFNGQSNRLLNREEQEVSLQIIPQNQQHQRKQLNQNTILKIEQDKQYFPRLDRQKKSTRRYQENSNRNIIPNQINQIFSFLQRKDKSGPLVQKLFRKFSHDAKFTPKRFYIYESLLKNNIGHYANQKSLQLLTELYEPKCENWSEKEQRYYIKICRCLVYHFLHEDSIFIILTSKRMKSEKKLDHLKARRQLYESVLKILKGCF